MKQRPAAGCFGCHRTKSLAGQLLSSIAFIGSFPRSSAERTSSKYWKMHYIQLQHFHYLKLKIFNLKNLDFCTFNGLDSKQFHEDFTFLSRTIYSRVLGNRVHSPTDDTLIISHFSRLIQLTKVHQRYINIVLGGTFYPLSNNDR